MKTEIIRKKNELDNYQAAPVESVQPVEFSHHTRNVDLALILYEDSTFHEWEDQEASYVQRKRQYDLILTPREIKVFCHLINLPDPLDNTNSGVFISRLIQSSYRAGNNDFSIKIPKMIDDLGSYLRGDKDAPINLTIEGHLRDFVAREAWNVKYLIRGNVGEDCATDANNCKIVIDGNAGYNLGKYSKDCEYVISGTTILPRHGSSNNTFELNLVCDIISSPDFPFMTGCIFKSKNEFTLDFLLKRITGNNNKFIRILDNGDEVEY